MSLCNFTSGVVNMFLIKKTNSRGFSLAEVLIVLLLISLLFTATIPVMTGMSYTKAGVDKTQWIAFWQMLLK